MQLTRFVIAVVLVSLVPGCPRSSPSKSLHRERATDRDRSCTDPERSSAYFYPAEDRTHYGPDDPHRDGCQILVPDHLFCCPNARRPTDR